jgi:acetolactate synthase-1/2/3 large subunit
MVRQWQGLFYEKRYSFVDISHQPDFVKLAEAYGAIGIRVKKVEEIDAALTRALEVTDRPVIIDFWVEREADVFPIVPPGATLVDMLGGD